MIIFVASLQHIVTCLVFSATQLHRLVLEAAVQEFAKGFTLFRCGASTLGDMRCFQVPYVLGCVGDAKGGVGDKAF